MFENVSKCPISYTFLTFPRKSLLQKIFFECDRENEWWMVKTEYPIWERRSSPQKSNRPTLFKKCYEYKHSFFFFGLIASEKYVQLSAGELFHLNHPFDPQWPKNDTKSKFSQKGWKSSLAENHEKCCRMAVRTFVKSSCKRKGMLFPPYCFRGYFWPKKLEEALIMLLIGQTHGCSFCISYLIVVPFWVGSSLLQVEVGFHCSGITPFGNLHILGIK